MADIFTTILAASSKLSQARIRIFEEAINALASSTFVPKLFPLNENLKLKNNQQISITNLVTELQLVSSFLMFVLRQ